MTELQAEFIGWFDIDLTDISICESLYDSDGFIPNLDEEGYSILIAAIADFLVVVCVVLLVYCNRRKHPDNYNTNQYLLPFYEHILWFYLIVVLLNGIFLMFKYFFDTGTDALNIDEKSVIFAIFRALQTGFTTAIQVFMFTILIQVLNISHRVKRIARIGFGTAFVCIASLVTCSHYLGYVQQEFALFIKLNICIYGLPVIYYLVLAVVFCSCRREQYTYHRRQRRRMIFCYSLSMVAIMSFGILAFFLMLFGFDGYCFDSVTRYLLKFYYPLLLIGIMKYDNMIWKAYIQSLFIQNENQQERILSLTKTICDCGLRKNENNQPLKIYENICTLISSNCQTFTKNEIADGNARIIGTGSKSEVTLRQLKNGEYVAVKQLWSDKRYGLINVAEYLKEAWIIADIKHENIVELKGICYDLSLDKNDFYLVYEYCNKGDLNKFLNLTNAKRGIDAQQISDRRQLQIRMKLLFDAAIGIHILHSNEIAHRDIKPDQIMVHQEEKTNQYTAKIGDFGGSKFLKLYSQNDAATLGDILGSPQASKRDVPVLEASVVGADAYREMTELGTSELSTSELRLLMSTSEEVTTFTTTVKELLAADIWAFGKVMWQVAYFKMPNEKAGTTEEILSWGEVSVDVQRSFNNNRRIYQDLTNLIESCWSRVSFRVQAMGCLQTLNRINEQLNVNTDEYGDSVKGRR